MKEVEFYAKAQKDASFRQQQLQEATEHKKMTQTLTWVLVGAATAYIAFCGIVERRMPDVDPLLFLLVLCSWGLTQSRTKVAALEAINQAGQSSQSSHLQS